jgi:hypothetical protein
MSYIEAAHRRTAAYYDELVSNHFYYVEQPRIL